MASTSELKKQATCKHTVVNWNQTHTRGQCIACRVILTENLPRYIYGLDPASKLDYFGIVVHKMPSYIPGQTNLPKLVTLRAITNTSYDIMIDILKKDLFMRYPPFYIVTDYSNEKTFSDLLMRDYGEKRVEEINFNPIANKQMLKDDGRAILQAGYMFPDPRLQKDVTQAELLKQLITQLKQEQMIHTPSGKITFDHPQGQHNDIAIAWELSVHGCQKFRLNMASGPVLATRPSGTIERKSGYKINDGKKHFPFLKALGVSINSIDTFTPN